MKKPALMPVFLCPGMDGMTKMPGAFFRRCPGMDGMVLSGFRNANDLAFRRYHAKASGIGRRKCRERFFVDVCNLTTTFLEANVVQPQINQKPLIGEL